jgi:hypothetical protein
MFLPLTMDSSKYTYSKSYAFTWAAVWLFILTAAIIRMSLNFSKLDWWLILYALMAVINLILTVIRYLLPALAAKTAIEVTNECIINDDERIAFTAVDHFVLYDSGIIAVILNKDHKNIKSKLNWLDRCLTRLFYRSSVIIDTRHVKVKGPVLFNELVVRLENPQFNVSL